MSRIGKKIINIPANVQIILADTNIKIIGTYGILEKKIFDNLAIEQEGNQLRVKCTLDNRKIRALHGLMRTLVHNMILGVSQQFSKTLLVEGIGYKFLLSAEKLCLNIGFTDPVFYLVPATLKITLESPTRLIITGINNEEVGLFAAKIRNARPPEPYKGKGIRYLNEKIRRKAGKTGKARK